MQVRGTRPSLTTIGRLVWTNPDLESVNTTAFVETDGSVLYRLYYGLQTICLVASFRGRGEVATDFSVAPRRQLGRLTSRAESKAF